MPRSDYKTCRACGGHTRHVGPLSHTRLCLVCAVDRMGANNVGIATRNGPAFDHWRRRSFLAARKLVLDDAQASA